MKTMLFRIQRLRTLGRFTIAALSGSAALAQEPTSSLEDLGYLTSTQLEKNNDNTTWVANQSFLNNIGALNQGYISLSGISDRYNWPANRNGHATSIPWDIYNIQTIEKNDSVHPIYIGPQDFYTDREILSPRPNATTISPDWLNSNQLGISFSNYEEKRATLNLNRVLIEDQLTTHISLLRSEKSDFDPHSGQTVLFTPYKSSEERIYGTWLFTPDALNKNDSNFTINGNFEKGNRERSGYKAPDYSANYSDNFDFEVFELNISHSFIEDSLGYRIDFLKQSTNEKGIIGDYSQWDYNVDRISSNLEFFAKHDFSENRNALRYLGNQKATIGYQIEKSTIPYIIDSFDEKGEARIKAPTLRLQGSWLKNNISASYTRRKTDNQTYTSPSLIQREIEQPFPDRDAFAVGDYLQKTITIDIVGLLSDNKPKTQSLQFQLTEDNTQVPTDNINTTDIFNRSIRNTTLYSKTATVKWISQDHNWIASINWRPNAEIINPISTDQAAIVRKILSRGDDTVEYFINKDPNEKWTEPPSLAAQAAGYSNQYDYIQEVYIPDFVIFKEALTERFPLVENWYKPDLTYSPPSHSYSGPSINGSVIAANESRNTNSWSANIVGNPTENWHLFFEASQNVFSNTVRLDQTYLSIRRFIQQNATESILDDIDKWYKVYGTDYFNSFSDDEAAYGEESKSIRRSNINIINSYSFKDGIFSGIEVGGALHYSKSRIPDSRYDRETDSIYDYIFSESKMDLWLGYKKEFENFDLQLQLTAFDIGDTEIDQGYNHRDWMLSSTFQF